MNRYGNYGARNQESSMESIGKDPIGIILPIALLAFAVYLFVKFLRWFWKVNKTV